MNAKKIAVGLVVFVILQIIVIFWIRSPYRHELFARLESQRQEENFLMEAQERQNTADAVVSKMQYIKDPRTGYCYALASSGVARYFSMTLVPENSIPQGLLTTARINVATTKVGK